MDVVLVGLPGSGKSAIGRRLAQRHNAAYVDLDETIERQAGMAISAIFEDEGEAGFRAREREAVAGLGPADDRPAVARVVATGGGAVLDPRNRWQLYRRRLPIWLDGRPEVLAQRLRRSPVVRPLVAGRDPIGSIRTLAAARERFYAPAHRVNGVAEVTTVLEAVESIVTDAATRRIAGGVLLDAATRIGRFAVGDGIAAATIDEVLRGAGAGRVILISEPGAMSAVGRGVADDLTARGWPVEEILVPQGEDAKRLAVIESTSRELARRRVERGEPLVALGGGALGDTAGFLAATWLRGVPLVHVPTTLVAQVDSSIGGKTGVDLPEGKNLVGAFHQPLAIVADVALLRTLPPRQLRAALGEAVKMAALGDERLFRLLEADGERIAAGDASAFEEGIVAEMVERAGWAKVEVVLADERESGLRSSLNLGHSLGHAIEAAAGFGELLHGEAVAYGLRGAARIGVARGTTPPERAARIERLLTRLGLAVDRLPYAPDTVRGRLAADKKHRGGRLRWILPTADGVTTDDDVPDDLVDRVTGELLAGEGIAA